ncbi:MAG: division/cell wall cluster transcriptional repressor MraZ [Planctomycetota bacterium]
MLPARFIGFYPHTLDEKGRVIIPHRFRDEIRDRETGHTLVITKSPEQCLFLYTLNQWDALSRSQESLNKGSRELWKFQRWFHATAEQLVPDKQGRVLIPERLRALAGIEREIVLAGCYDRIEVWSKAGWEQAQDEALATYGDSVDMFLTGGTAVTQAVPDGQV